MPCAAPCTRLPCNKRCPLKLPCGHQCPGICGEDCPEQYCQICSDRKQERVDLLEMKVYGEIDLNETPIVILGCGHFLTAESLDGHIGIADVYKQAIDGEFTALRDVSNSLARSIPRCPDCQQPVRQYSTQRYNRVINRAVIDEMSKRFLTNGKAELRGLEETIIHLELDLEQSRKALIDSIGQVVGGSTEDQQAINVIIRQLNDRHARSRKLEKAVLGFRESVADRYQPAQVLHDATVSAARQKSLDQMMTDLDITASVPAIARDRRITFGGRIAQLQAECAILTDRFEITQAMKSAPSGIFAKVQGSSPEKLVKSFFTTCVAFIDECSEQHLPKLAVEAILYFARTARSNEAYCQSLKMSIEESSDYVEVAKEVLMWAKELCAQPFQNAKSLEIAVDESIKLLRKSWYEEVTAEELAAIKQAMIGGSRGFATHSGHWYNCINGHPVSVFHYLYVPMIYADHNIVRYRRMRHADGAGSMSRVWSSRGWTESSGCRGSHSSDGDGRLRYAWMSSSREFRGKGNLQYHTDITIYAVLIIKRVMGDSRPPISH